MGTTVTVTMTVTTLADDEPPVGDSACPTGFALGGSKGFSNFLMAGCWGPPKKCRYWHFGTPWPKQADPLNSNNAVTEQSGKYTLSGCFKACCQSTFIANQMHLRRDGHHGVFPCIRLEVEKTPHFEKLCMAGVFPKCFWAQQIHSNKQISWKIAGF